MRIRKGEWGAPDQRVEGFFRFFLPKAGGGIVGTETKRKGFGGPGGNPQKHIRVWGDPHSHKSPVDARRAVGDRDRTDGKCRHLSISFAKK